MGKLTKILEYTYADNSDKKKILNRPNFPKEIKNLILTEGMNEETLVNEEINNALIAGAETRSVIRKVLPTVSINTYNSLIPNALSPSGCIDAVGEGAPAPELKNPYASGSIKYKKYSTKIGITNEMVEDCRWDLIEFQIKRAGALLENSLNRAGMTELLDMHNGTKPADVDPTHLHIQIQDLALARERLKNEYWGGGNIAFIGHPNSLKYLFVSGGNNLAPYVAPNRGSQLMGMDIYELYTDLEPYRVWNGATPKFWDASDSANHYYGIVLDSDNYAVIGMREDIHVTNKINDPIHDITNLVASTKFGVKVINNKAAVRILSK